MCSAFMHTSHAYICYNLLEVSMTSLEPIKKRGANSPRSPLLPREPLAALGPQVGKP